MSLGNEILKKEEKPSTPQRGYVNGNLLNTESLDEAKVVAKPKKNDDKLGLIIILVVFLAVNILGILFFVFDIGYIRTKFIAFQNSSLSIMADNKAFIAKLDSERKQLEDEKIQVEEEKNRITELDTKQKQKEEELNKLATELENKRIENETMSATAINAPTATEPKATKVADVVKIYEGMEAKDAAKIISSLDLEDKLIIIKNIKKDKAAEILSAMDSTQSASILKELMKD